MAWVSASAKTRALSGRVGAIRFRARRVGNTYGGASHFSGHTPITPGRSAARAGLIDLKGVSVAPGDSVAIADSWTELDGPDLGTTPSRTSAPGLARHLTPMKWLSSVRRGKPFEEPMNIGRCDVRGKSGAPRRPERTFAKPQQIQGVCRILAQSRLYKPSFVLKPKFIGCGTSV